MSANNTIILNGCIKEFRDRNELRLSESDIFELFVVTQLFKRFDLSFDEIEATIVDGSQDGGIDSFIILVNDLPVNSDEDLSEITLNESTLVRITIVQSKIEKSFKESSIDKLMASIEPLYNLELSEDALLERFNPALVGQIILFRKLWKTAARKLSPIEIQYVYACKANEEKTNKAFDSKSSQLVKLTEEKVHGAKVAFCKYSARQLIDLFQTVMSPKLDLEFRETPVSVTYGNGNIGYIGVATLNSYKKFLIDQLGNLQESIFESNVRHFQGNVDVNKRIRETLEDCFASVETGKILRVS